MPSPHAAAALALADQQLASATADMADHERNVFGPLRGNIERNHIADKIKRIVAA